MNNDVKVLSFVVLALRDTMSPAKNRKDLVSLACDYGKGSRLTREEVERVLDKKVIDFIPKGD